MGNILDERLVPAYSECAIVADLPLLFKDDKVIWPKWETCVAYLLLVLLSVQPVEIITGHHARFSGYVFFTGTYFCFYLSEFVPHIMEASIFYFKWQIFMS